jgi:hypothetical protein
MTPMVFVLLGVLFVVAAILLWRSRRGGTGDLPANPLGDGDRPEPALSTESSIGPNRNLGRTWKIDRGERPGDNDGEGI